MDLPYPTAEPGNDQLPFFRPQINSSPLVNEFTYEGIVSLRELELGR